MEEGGTKNDKGVKKQKTSGGFEGFGLSPLVYRSVKLQGYRIPTPVQRKTIPAILEGNDVVAMARTGSGKTAAFLIPMFERLKSHLRRVGVRGLIVSPTRELALQTVHFIKQLGRFLDLRTAVLIGGEALERDFEALTQNPDVVVATPGRLLHHLLEVPEFTLSSVEYVVFDEADRLFEMGFADQLRELLSHLPDRRQTLLFSATIPRDLADFAAAGLHNPLTLRLDTEDKLSENLSVAFFTLRAEEKAGALLFLLTEHIPEGQQALIFVATRHHSEYLYELLTLIGMDVGVVFGSMDQTARKLALSKFRSKKCSFLIVTDVAARGLDIPLLDNVINYDFPFKPKTFVHRVGRVARAGRSGSAYSLVSAEELPYMIDLHLYLGAALRNGPVEQSSEQNGHGSMDNALSEVYFGSFPREVLDSQNETVRMLHRRNLDLDSLCRVAKNAEKLVRKTRPKASGESVRRSKSLIGIKPHPVLAIGGNLAQQEDILQSLRAFRPTQTILELGDHRQAGREDVRAQADAFSTLRQERAKRVVIVEESAQTAVGMPSRRVKSKRERMPRHPEDDVILSYMPAGKRSAEAEMEYEERSQRYAGRSEVDQAVLDLVPDEAEEILKRRRRLKWDRKRKRFVQESGGVSHSLSKRKRINESGVAIDKGAKKSHYAQWKQKYHRRVQGEGEEEEGAALMRVLNVPDRAARWRGGGKHPRGGHDTIPARELKTVEEIVKSRRVKARQQMRQTRGKRGRG